jgi:hypothetical protein
VFRTVAAAALAALLGLVVAPSASAQRSGLFAQLRVERSNGYRIGIDAVRWQHPRKHGEVTVSVFKRTAESIYTAPARLTRHRLDAGLGRFGRIGVSFHQGIPGVASVEDTLADRRGRRPKAFAPSSLILGSCSTAQSGSNGRLEGRIRFRGEDGYARVGARSAHGFMETVETRCQEGGELHGVALNARSDGVRFEALRLRPRWRSARGFFATEKKSVGEVAIMRLAFTFDSALTSAHLEPPGPIFSGFADFASPSEWTGSLAASFPGDPHAPLAGVGFSARLGRH